MQISNVLADFQTPDWVGGRIAIIKRELRKQTIYRSAQRDFEVSWFLNSVEDEIHYFMVNHQREPKIQMTRHLIALIASPRNVVAREDGCFDAQLFGLDIECIDEKGYVCVVSIKE